MEIVKIYLSGGMTSVSFEEQSKWRNQIIDAINYNYDCEKKAVFFNPVDYYNFSETRHKSEREIMEFDLNGLRNSNLVIFVILLVNKVINIHNFFPLAYKIFYAL